MSTLYRAQILLKPEQHEALKEIAHTDGRSISEVVREIVRQYLAERQRDLQLERELQAIEDLARTRKEIQERHGVYDGDLLAEARSEREQDMERVWVEDQ
jgi:hypothetical protein